MQLTKIVKAGIIQVSAFYYSLQQRPGNKIQLMLKNMKKNLEILRKIFTFAHRTIKQDNMENNNVIFQIPPSDMTMITMLAKKTRWTIQCSDTILKRFKESRSSDDPISSKDIAKEIRAVKNKL